MLTLLIVAGLLVVLSPFAAIPLLRRDATYAEDSTPGTPEGVPDLTLRGVRGLER